jgi:hypothetical protein
MKGYFRKPEETRNILSSDGWLRTGDIGRIDSDGFLAITGRAKEMLIIGGENVFPREIEAVLESHEAVLQAAVIGMTDGLRGEVPIAFVMPKKDAEVSEDQLRIFARERLASFKTPRRIVIREDLPTGPTGKILKRRLKELHTRHGWHPLIDQEQRDRIVAQFQLLDRFQGVRTRVRSHDPVTIPVLPAQVALDGPQHVGIVIHCPYHRLGHMLTISNT